VFFSGNSPDPKPLHSPPPHLCVLDTFVSCLFFLWEQAPKVFFVFLLMSFDLGSTCFSMVLMFRGLMLSPFAGIAFFFSLDLTHYSRRVLLSSPRFFFRVFLIGRVIPLVLWEIFLFFPFFTGCGDHVPGAFFSCWRGPFFSPFGKAAGILAFFFLIRRVTCPIFPPRFPAYSILCFRWNGEALGNFLLFLVVFFLPWLEQTPGAF